MTQVQESAATRKLVTPERAFKAPFLAITAGLVVLLMALAVMSFAVAGRPSGPIDGNAGQGGTRKRYAWQALHRWLGCATQHRDARAPRSSVAAMAGRRP